MALTHGSSCEDTELLQQLVTQVGWGCRQLVFTFMRFLTWGIRNPKNPKIALLVRDLRRFYRTGRICLKFHGEGRLQPAQQACFH